MAWLAGLLLSFGTWIVERIGKYFLGIGAFGVAYVGVDVLVNRVFNNISASLGGNLSAIYNILMLLGFGEALNILLSACAFALAMSISKKAVE